jgi:hypothetical protein
MTDMVPPGIMAALFCRVLKLVLELDNRLECNYDLCACRGAWASFVSMFQSFYGRVHKQMRIYIGVLHVFLLSRLTDVRFHAVG